MFITCEAKSREFFLKSHHLEGVSQTAAWTLNLEGSWSLFYHFLLIRIKFRYVSILSRYQNVKFIIEYVLIKI